MIRANVGASRKISKDFNSTGYSVNLDGEITASVTDPEAVIEQVKELFDLAEEALNQQIERDRSIDAIASRDVEPQQRQLANGRSPGRNGNRTVDTRAGAADGEEVATNKQVQYLLTIGKRQQLSTLQLEQKVAGILGYEVGVYDLTKKAAAMVIDALTKGPTNGHAAARN